VHVLGIEPRGKQQQVGMFMLADKGRFHAYGNVFSSLHPKAWEEVKAMAKNKREKFELDIRPSVEFLGLEKVIDQIGKKQLLEQLDVDDILANQKGHASPSTRDRVREFAAPTPFFF
jgi:hypothetical protein